MMDRGTVTHDVKLKYFHDLVDQFFLVDIRLNEATDGVSAVMSKLLNNRSFRLSFARVVTYSPRYLRLTCKKDTVNFSDILIALHQLKFEKKSVVANVCFHRMDMEEILDLSKSF